MKILQANNFYHLRGGSDKAFLNTVSLLRSQQHEVTSFASDENFDPSSYPLETEDVVVSAGFNKGGLHTVLNGAQFFYNKSIANQFEQLIDTTQPEIVHLHTIYGRLTNSILPILKKRQIKTVMTLHDYRMMCPVNVFLDGKAQICTKCQSGNYLHGIMKNCKNYLPNSVINSLECYFRDMFFEYSRFVGHFIFPSRFSMQLHLENTDLTEERCHLLPNFTPPVSNGANLKKKNSFLCFGRISEEKGVFNLAEKWPINGSVFLDIVGTGSETSISRLNGIIEGKPNVRYLGGMYGKQLDEIVKSSSYVVVPSICYENNPMTILEAFSHGTPVVASRIGGIPEIVTHEVDGFLYDPFSADSFLPILEKCISLLDENYMDLSRQAKISYEQRYSESVHYRHLLDIYEKVLQ